MNIPDKCRGITTAMLASISQILFPHINKRKTLCFFYDQQGNRVAMADGSNHIYYYLYNIQGDVIALADSATGKLVATYTYDAWGKCTVQNATGFTAGTENPFRYRGYYYDSETGLYYLQSRYYDSETGRFINADAFATTDITTPLSANMFAYCENNPVMREDPAGEWFHIAVGAAVGAVGSVASQMISDIITSTFTGNISLSSWETYVGAAIGGAVGGAVFATTANSAAAGAASGFVSTFTSGALQKNETNSTWGEIASESVIDGVKGAAFGKLGDKIGVNGVTKGRNSFSAVYKSGLTKLKNGTAKRMSYKVMKKGLVSSIVGDAASTLFSAAKRIISFWRK